MADESSEPSIEDLVEHIAVVGTGRSVKVIIEVTGGVIPDDPMAEYSRRWAVYSDEAETPEGYYEALQRVFGHAMLYYLGLSDHRRVNWTRLEWLYL